MDQRLRSFDKSWRTKFNEIASVYDQMRPTYTRELFEDIIRYSALDHSKSAVEVGIGTGQATLPFLQTGCSVTAVEIGDELAKFSKKKFSEYRNFHIINDDFENVSLSGGAYDLFYCASAFHWIPKEIGYPKAFRILKSGGTLALFFIRPFPSSETDPVHLAMQEVYRKYMPVPAEGRRFQEEDCSEIIGQIREYGFADAHYKLYHGERTFLAEEYVLLLSTFSDHRAMPKERWEPFQEGIKEAINRHGGQFTLHDTMDLYLARKP